MDISHSYLNSNIDKPVIMNNIDPVNIASNDEPILPLIINIDIINMIKLMILKVLLIIFIN